MRYLYNQNIPEMKNRLFLLSILAVLFIVSCKSKRNDGALLDVKNDQEVLSKYFMAATVGVISSGDELKYVLNSPLEKEVPASTLKNIITLDPAVDGEVILQNNTILVFKPTSGFVAGQTYKVNLNLKSLDSKRFTEDLSYYIKTFAQDMKVEREGLIINADGSVTMVVVARTADIADPEKLKSCFISDADHVDIIERTANEYELNFNYKRGMKKESAIKYDGKVIGADVSGGVALFDVNPDQFGVVYSHYDLAEKAFNIYFSQRLSSQADLTGLVRVQDQNAKYAVNNNVLTIYLGDVRTLSIAVIKVDKGIRSVENNTLLSDFNFELQLNVDKPDAQFVDEGNYFPSEGDFRIPIRTRALEALRIMVIEIKQENVMHYLAWNSLENADFYNLRMYGRPVYDQLVPLTEGVRDGEGWTVHGIDLTSRIRKNPGSIYHISLDFGPENTSLSCKKNLAKYDIHSKIPGEDYFKTKESYYNDYYEYNEGYVWEENQDPCKLSFYLNRYPSNKIFICSDFSIVAKKAGTNFHFAVNKLMDLDAVPDAELTLYNLQGESITSVRTTSDGMAEAIRLGDAPAVVKISKNNQVTYLSLDENQSNSLTEFDVAGERTETETEFFAYTDRDVWRPGDSIFVDLMVNKSQSDLPKGLPVVMTFYNTENLVIDEQVQQIDLDRKLIYNFTVHTPAAAKTGTYRCMFRVGPKTIRKNIRVETIKPNTAETTFQFDNLKDNIIYSENLSGSLAVKYLTGFEVGEAGVKAVGLARKISNPFPDYSDYMFDIYNNEEQESQFDIVDAKTNDKGVVSFQGDQNLKRYNSPVRVSVETETTLPGGGTNKEGSSVKVFPFESYIGSKRKEGTGWNGNHTFTESIEVGLIHLNDRGKADTRPAKISYILQKHVNSWWVDKYTLRSNGNFVQSDYWQNQDEGSLTITGKGKYAIAKGKLTKGAYRVTFTDDASGHMSQTYFTVYDGKETIPGSQPYIIELQTDKDRYKAGETVNLRFPPVSKARVLISIERGNRVIKQSWFDLSSTNTNINLPTDASWAPNVYIHATVMQPYKQKENDLPLRMYGIKHIFMDGSASVLMPLATIPDKMESGMTYTFAVSEKNGNAMEYTLALVDEGLLNLTGYATPDPSKHFNGKFPLLVRTWDIYQYLINYFKGKFAGIITIGGDDAYHPDALPEISRFKPVAMHQGSFKLSANGKNTHKVTIPNYIGKVRLMIVACSDNNFGKLEKLIPVKNPLMVQAQFPRSLNVSDKLQLPVTVLRDDPSISAATLSAVSDPSMVKGLSASRNISFTGKNQVLNIYDLEVLNKTGKLNVEMNVSGNGKTMKEATEILVNYPNSYESSVAAQIIEPGGTATIAVTPKGYREVFSSGVMISGLKVPNFTKYADELVEYPYGCLEQTTSAGFAQLYLDKVLSLDPQKNRIRLENLQATINKLSRLQNANGKFNYWDNNYYHFWSDIYAGNFLVEAQMLGYLGNKSDMLTQWLEAHSTSANNWALAEVSSTYVYESEVLAQAFRLYVLAKAGKPAKSAMNRFVTSQKSINSVTWWLMAGAFKLSGYDSKADELVAKAENLQKEYNQERSYGTFGDQGRDWAIIVDILSHFDNHKKKMEAYYDQMVDVINKSYWTSTQTKGFAFISAYRYFGKSLGISNTVEYTMSGLPGGSKSYVHSAFEPRLTSFTTSSFDKKITVRNTGKGKLYLYQTDRYIDNNLAKKASAENLGVAIDYYNLTRKKQGLTGIMLGDDIQIHVRVTNPTALEVENLALNVKMPSGWELINPRIYETNISDMTEKYTYQDFKDDRVYTFFGLAAGEGKSFTFRAKAAFTGDFFHPSISCEHMYKGSVNARTATDRMVVSK